MLKMTKPPYYQDIATLARNLGVTEDEVERCVKSGKLPEPKNINGVLRWSWEEVDAAWGGPLKKFRRRATEQIYIVGFNSYVKIGFTTDLKRRLASLQTGLPELLVLYASIKRVKKADEARLHIRFAAYRLQGEWFRKEGDLATWIEAGCPL